MADNPPSADAIDAAIVARLIEARHRQGLRQVDVAQRLGRPQAYVSRYETRETMLGVGDVFVIAHALGIDPIRLLEGSAS